MDTARAVFGRLMVSSLFPRLAVSLFFLLTWCLPSAVFAQYYVGTYSTYAAALAACQSSMAGLGPPSYSAGYFTVTQSCVTSTDTSTSSPTVFLEAETTNGAFLRQDFDFQGSLPPSNPCSSLPANHGDFTYNPGQNLPVQKDMDVKDPNTGATVTCHATMKASGIPTMDAFGHLHVQLNVTWDPNPGTNDGNAAGSSAYLDSSGTSLNPQPVVTQGPSPQLCGGGSCYDPNAGTFSTVGPSGSASLPDSVADSSSGGCASSGSVTMCAGSPSPPLPPAPPASQITDPATQVQGSDTYQQQNPTSGSMSSVTVTTYAGQGSKSSSGSTSTSQPANSRGPGAPASSSSSAGDGVSGGGSCTSPPACTGDAVQCAVVAQTYDTRCNVSQVHTDLAGTQSPPQSGQHQASEVDGGTVDIGQQAANLDTGGFGFSTACPFTVLTVPFRTITVTLDFTWVCNYQGFFSSLILLAAGMMCAEILGGRR